MAKQAQGFVVCFAVLFLSLGCGGGRTEHELFLVKGAVTCDGQSVTEGSVLFEDHSNGRTGEGEIGADGFYRVKVTKGSYTVIVNPPMIEVDEGPESPASTEYKDVDNIPEKYRGYGSPIIVDVTADTESADVAMTSGGE